MSNKETPPYDMSIHSNPSAMAWTKFFRECRPECNLDDETMLGWFANAMMAMHDHIYQTSPPTRKPLSDEEIFEIGYKAGFAIDSIERDLSLDYGFLDEDGDVDNEPYFKLVRAIEKAHGITGIGQ